MGSSGYTFQSSAPSLSCQRQVPLHQLIAPTHYYLRILSLLLCDGIHQCGNKTLQSDLLFRGSHKMVSLIRLSDVDLGQKVYD